jgi:hypothetical protein
MYHHLPFLYPEVKNKETMDVSPNYLLSFILFSINEMNVPKIPVPTS